MIQYPSIPGSKFAEPGREVYAFRKYDGSNLRFEYTKKKGWCKFGSRKRTFDHRDQQFGEVIDLFHDCYAEELTERIQPYIPSTRVVVFMEYLGDNSFAGSHFDEPKRLVLFDVHVKKKGLISPTEFMHNFSTLEFSQELIWKGVLTVDQIHEFQNTESLGEGVILKSDDGWYCKVKTNLYMKRLQDTFGIQWKNHWE